MTRFLILALLLTGCSERAKPRTPAVVATRQQSGISVSKVEKVHITAGFNVITDGRRHVVYDGILLRVSGLNPTMFEERAMTAPSFIVGSSIAKVVVYPPFPTGEARVLAPLPPAGSQVTLWLTGLGVVGMNLDATALEQERQRAKSTTGYWCTFTAPSAAAATRQYTTFNELKFAENPLRLTRTQCEQELGKQCGIILNSRLGPVDCGGCAADEKCMSDNLCCKPRTCVEQGDQCGNVPDGCGGSIYCPCPCPADQPYRCCDNVTCSATKGCPEMTCDPAPNGGGATK